MNLSCWHLQEFYVSTKNQPVPSVARLCSVQYKPVPLCGGLVWTVLAMTSCGVVCVKRETVCVIFMARNTGTHNKLGGIYITYNIHLITTHSHATVPTIGHTCHVGPHTDTEDFNIYTPTLCAFSLKMCKHTNVLLPLSLP